MRLIAMAGLAALGGTAWADRLVDVPLGRKLLQGAVRVRGTGVAGGGGAGQALVGTGLFDSYDLDVDLRRGPGSRWSATLDASFNLSPPITDVAPGISFGVQDLADRTPHGRAAFIAFTQRFGNYGEWNQDTPTEVTVGLWSRRDGAAFVGVSLPFWDRLLLVGEATGSGVVAGLEARPLAGFSLRWLAGPTDHRFQAGLLVRF
jgi:hypothetical protein